MLLELIVSAFERVETKLNVVLTNVFISEQGTEEVKKLLLLLLGCAVQVS